MRFGYRPLLAVGRQGGFTAGRCGLPLWSATRPVMGFVRRHGMIRPCTPGGRARQPGSPALFIGVRIVRVRVRAVARGGGALGGEGVRMHAWTSTSGSRVGAPRSRFVSGDRFRKHQKSSYSSRAFRASGNSALSCLSARRCIHRWSRRIAAVGSLVARHGVWPLFWGAQFRGTGLGPLRPLLNFCRRFADTLSSRHGMRPHSRNSQIARAIGSQLVRPCLYRGEAIPHRTDPDNAFVSKSDRQ